MHIMQLNRLFTHQIVYCGDNSSSFITSFAILANCNLAFSTEENQIHFYPFNKNCVFNLHKITINQIIPLYNNVLASCSDDGTIYIISVDDNKYEVLNCFREKSKINSWNQQ